MVTFRSQDFLFKLNHHSQFDVNVSRSIGSNSLLIMSQVTSCHEITWKFGNVFVDSVKKSRLFSVPNVTHDTNGILVADFRANGEPYYGRSYTAAETNLARAGAGVTSTTRKCAIFFDASAVISTTVDIQLVANNDTLLKLPINWLGTAGNSADNRIFGSTAFMDNLKLQNDYVSNGQLTVLLTISVKDAQFKSRIIEPRLSESFDKMFENKLHTDAILVCQRKEIKVHNSILAARSPVFAAMFDHELAETKSGKVNIKDIEFDPLRALVKYLYTDNIELKDGQFALKIFVAADKYDVPSLKALAEKFIAGMINDSVVVDALAVGKTLNSEMIKNACITYITVKKKKADVLGIPGIKDLSCELLLEILGNLVDKLNP